MRPLPRRRATCSSRSSPRLPESPACVASGIANANAPLCCRARGDPRWACEDERHRAGTGRRGRHHRAAGRRWIGCAVGGSPTIRKGPSPVNGASRPTVRRRLRSRRTGARSRRLSSSAARSSGRGRPITSAARSTRPITTRSSGSAATTSPRRAREPRTRPKSGCSGSRARRWRGTASRARSRSSRGFDLWENARLFGLLNLAMADGYIASWEAKYHYRFWRPITAIRLGDTDGNPDTQGVPDWTPLQFTYPMPDHDSGHAVQGGVAAEILKQVFGTDDISFTACSTTVGAGQGVHGSDAGDPLVFELLAGSRRERRVADLHRHSLPESRRGRRSTWTEDRGLRRSPVHEARSLSVTPGKGGHQHACSVTLAAAHAPTFLEASCSLRARFHR